MAGAFARAVAAGTFGGALLPSVLLTIAAFADPWRAPDAIPLYAQLGITVGIALGFVLIGAIAIGIPVRLLMRRLAIEGPISYLIVGALSGAVYLWILLAPFREMSSAIFLLPLGALAGAATAYTWWRSRPGSKTDTQLTNRIDRFAARPRSSRHNLQFHHGPPSAVPQGDIRLPPIAFVLGLVVVAFSGLVGVAPEGGLDWLPRQAYFPPAYRTTEVDCVAERFQAAKGRTLMVDDIEAEWYPQHWRAAQEPSLYMASRSEAGKQALTYRFTWLRSFHPTVIVRVDESPDGGLRLRAKQLSGRGGYSPGKSVKTVDRQLTSTEAARLRWAIEASRLFDQPQIGCLEGVDGANWLIEANDRGRYRYLKRWTPESGPVHQTGMMLLSLTGWSFRDVY